MTRFTHTVLLASAMTFGLAATAQALMVDMAFEDLSVKGETLSVEKMEPMDTIKEVDSMEKMDSMESMKTMDMSTDASVSGEVETVLVSCPEGTTAQTNGTCMITGDYKE